jgi:hypothetical protein
VSILSIRSTEWLKDLLVTSRSGFHPKPLPRIEHIGAFPSRSLHLGLEEFDLAFLDGQRTLGYLRPVELDEVLDDLQRRDDEHIHEALRCLDVVNRRRIGVLVDGPFQIVAHLGLTRYRNSYQPKVGFSVVDLLSVI